MARAWSWGLWVGSVSPWSQDPCTLTAFKVKLRGSLSSPALRTTLAKVALQSLLWDGQLPAYPVSQ